jgi:hypothetical protein
MKMGIILVAGIAAGVNAQWINEFQPNPTGLDPSDVDIELRGDAGASFSGWLVSIESDGGSSAGTVDRATAVSGSFDSNGILVVNIPDLENPSFTLVLSSDFTGAIGTDYDAGNDGMFDDASIFGTVFDAIGTPDNTGDEATIFGGDLGGVDFAFTGDEPKLIFRDSIDPSILYAVNDPAGTEAFDQLGNAYDLATAFFDSAGNAVDLSSGNLETFGAVNFTTIPTPGAAAVLGFAGLAAARRRR